MLNRLCDGVFRVCRSILEILVLLVLLSVVVDVGNRYIFGQSFPALQWLIVFGISWTTFLGTAVAFRSNSHFFVDLFGYRIKRLSTQKLHGYFILIFDFLAVIALLVTGYGFARLGLIKKSPATGFSMVFTYSSIFAGGLVMGLFAIEKLLKNIHCRTVYTGGEAL